MFIGRQEEQRALLAMAHRITTVFGVAGVGKSTLLKHVVGQIHESPTYWLDVSSFVHVSELIARLASELELPWQWPEHLGSDDAVTHFARMWRHNMPKVIVVFDHVEWSYDLVKTVLPLLIQGHDGLCCLLGSRMQLGVDGEHVIHLDPFDTTSPDNAAVALFVAHAEQFKESESHLEHIHTLVSRLNGLPLAVVLAANRSKWMSPQQLLQRLESEDTNSTFKALSHAIDMSWQMLDGQSQHHYMLCGLIPFGIDAQLGAYLFECNEETAKGYLDRLVSYSLLQKRFPDQWDMLYSIAQHAREKLNSHPDGQHHQWRLAQYIGQLGRESYFEAAASVYTCGVLTHYAPHLLQSYHLAHDCLARGVFEAEACLDVITNALLGLSLVWHKQCALEQLERECARVVLLKAQMNAEQYARYGLAFAVWAASQNKLEQVYDRLHEHYHAHQWSRPMARAMAMFLLLATKHAYAPEYAKHYAQVVSEAIDDNLSTAWQAQLGYYYAHYKVLSFQFEEAITRGEQIVELLQPLGWVSYQAKCLHLKAFALHQLNRFEEGNRVLMQCTQTYAKTNDFIAQAHSLRFGIFSDIDQMSYRDAEAKYRQLQGLFERYRFFFLEGTIDLLAGQLKYAQDQHVEARRHFEEALKYFELRDKPDQANISKLYLILLEMSDHTPNQTLVRLEALFEQTQGLSFWIQTLVVGASIGVAVLADALDVAQSWQLQLAPAREKNGLFDALGHIYDNCVRWPSYEQQEKARQLSKAAKTYSQILTSFQAVRTFIPAISSALEPMPLELRVGMDLFWARTGIKYKAQVLADLHHADLNTMTILAHKRTYRPPGQSAWVAYQRDAVPLKLLMWLVHTHQREPGRWLSSEALCAALWPDEQGEDQDVLSNRLYVALQALKYNGLEQHIEHQRDAGYRLSTELVIYGDAAHDEHMEQVFDQRLI